MPGLQSREGWTALGDRYAGRHIRQSRHGAWMWKKRARSRSRTSVLPTAAALTISGVLIGGAGAVIQFGDAEDGPSNTAYDPADYPPPDRNAQLNRASRDEARTAPATGEVTVIESGSCQATLSTGAVGLTAATDTLPANSVVRVTNLANGRSVDVWVREADSSAGTDVCLNLSAAAFERLGESAGVVDVRYEVLVQDAT